MRNKLALAALAAAGVLACIGWRKVQANADKPGGGMLAGLVDLARTGSPDRAARSNAGWKPQYPTEAEVQGAAAREVKTNPGDAVGWSTSSPIGADAAP